MIERQREKYITTERVQRENPAAVFRLKSGGLMIYTSMKLYFSQ